jgi:GT2 family glycosyltransferase
MAYSVCIPTVGRIETLPTVLFSILGQKGVSEVIILDEASVPVCESFVVNQALDLLSLSKGIEVRVIRRRRRGGIGKARVDLINEAKNDYIVMVDDDVVLGERCAEVLVSHSMEHASWAVPTCVLISAGLELDGYTDQVVDAEDPKVKQWTERYPWFMPYFRYSKVVIETHLGCAGTQCIAFSRDRVKDSFDFLDKNGALPREDTLFTRVTGPGVFYSGVECYHFEHKSQVTRGQWDRRMFYRVHEAILKDPKAYIELMGY